MCVLCVFISEDCNVRVGSFLYMDSREEGAMEGNQKIEDGLMDWM